MEIYGEVGSERRENWFIQRGLIAGPSEHNLAQCRPDVVRGAPSQQRQRLVIPALPVGAFGFFFIILFPSSLLFFCALWSTQVPTFSWPGQGWLKTSLSEEKVKPIFCLLRGRACTNEIEQARHEVIKRKRIEKETNPRDLNGPVLTEN